MAYFFRDLKALVPFNQLYDVEDILSKLSNFINSQYLPHSIKSLLPSDLLEAPVAGAEGNTTFGQKISDEYQNISEHIESLKSQGKKIKDEIERLVHTVYDLPQKRWMRLWICINHG